MKKLIVASNNNHKVKEIKEILKEFNFEILSLKEAGINIDVDENGTTFEENAHIKANEIFKIVKDAMVLADDSGLMVDALQGEPGVYSARYSGEHGNYEKNNEKLLLNLKNVRFEDRKAKFMCAMELIIDEGKVIKVQGEVNGYILESPKGENGFAYDPLFYVPELKKSMGEITPEEKNFISHRGKALKNLKKSIDVL